MPRAALLSIHARVEGAHPSSWEDPSLVQVWGLRFSTYVVPARDRALFTLGRLPDDAPGRERAEEIAARLHAFLDGRRMGDGEAGQALGVNSNLFRYAAPTGTVLIRWEGARQPTIWTVPRPEVDPLAAAASWLADTCMCSARRRLRRSRPGRASGPPRRGRLSTG
jgi:hypothetical protein